MTSVEDVHPMSTRRVTSPSAGIGIALVTAVTLIPMQRANADYLHWGTNPLKTNSVSDAYEFSARRAAHSKCPKRPEVQG